MSEESARPRALRLIFERRGDEVALVEALPLDKVVPASDELDVDDTQLSGFGVRLYGRDGTLLYRRRMADPMARDIEVWTGDPDYPWNRVPADPSIPVLFDIIVPNTGDEEAEVELLASPPRAQQVFGEGAKPVARLKVRASGSGSQP